MYKSDMTFTCINGMRLITTKNAGLQHQKHKHVHVQIHIQIQKYISQYASDIVCIYTDYSNV